MRCAAIFFFFSFLFFSFLFFFFLFFSFFFFFFLFLSFFFFFFIFSRFLSFVCFNFLLLSLGLRLCSYHTLQRVRTTATAPEQQRKRKLTCSQCNSTGHVPSAQCCS